MKRKRERDGGREVWEGEGRREEGPHAVGKKGNIFRGSPVPQKDFGAELKGDGDAPRAFYALLSPWTICSRTRSYRSFSYHNRNTQTKASTVTERSKMEEEERKKEREGMDERKE